MKTPYTELTHDEDVGSWYRELAQHLLDEMRATPPDTRVWTWVEEDRSPRFVGRRCANELAIHRYDAQDAAREQQPIPPITAVEAIEEIFLMLDGWGTPPESGRVTLDVHSIDTADEWLITLTPSGAEIERGPGDADLDLTGRVSDLALVLFDRPPIGTVEGVGDPAALEVW